MKPYKPPFIYGMHDPGGEHHMLEMGTPGWIVFTHALGADPNNTTGFDYRFWANQGFGILARLNYGYEPNGTIPTMDRYSNFAQRAANWVAASRGCGIWIIGNEMNYAVERPGGPVHGNPILPSSYGMCFLECRERIKSLAGHDEDEVVVGAVAPWNAQTRYSGNPTGDWVQYMTDVLKYLRPPWLGGLSPRFDGIALHTYTHGTGPNLIWDETKWPPPYENYHYHFKTYVDFMQGIPLWARGVPVYITETDQGDVAWANENTGWVQNAYADINWWNSLPCTQKIQALCLYRWPKYDRWHIEGKEGVIADWRDAMKRQYRWTDVDVDLNPDIVFLMDSLPKHDTLEYRIRALNQIEEIAVHHTVAGNMLAAERIAWYHVNADVSRGKDPWPGIGYHFYITADGTIYQTNHLETISYHVGNFNTRTIGIALAGNFMSGPPTDAQLAAAKKLVAWLMRKFDWLQPEDIKGHKEFHSGTACPGATWDNWKGAILP